MTVEQIEAVLAKTDVKIALRHRFAFNTGTLLRLDNFLIINVFDDGRYYVQGTKTAELLAELAKIGPPWDPETWSGEMPRQALTDGFSLPGSIKWFES